jgi:hypothetical protein
MRNLRQKRNNVPKKEKADESLQSDPEKEKISQFAMGDFISRKKSQSLR